MPGGWPGVPVVPRLAEALEAPTALINDARAFALAESELGAARGCDTAVFVAIGTGVGGGITVGGRFHEGRAGPRARSATSRSGRKARFAPAATAAAWRRSCGRRFASVGCGGPGSCSGSGRERDRAACAGTGRPRRRSRLGRREAARAPATGGRAAGVRLGAGRDRSSSPSKRRSSCSIEIQRSYPTA